MSLTLYNLVSKGWFMNVELNLSCPAGGYSSWKNIQWRSSRGEAVVTTLKMAQALNSRLVTGDQISQSSKVELRVVISEEYIRRELGMT